MDFGKNHVQNVPELGKNNFQKTVHVGLLLKKIEKRFLGKIIFLYIKELFTNTKEIIMTPEQFETALQSWFVGAQKIVTDYYGKDYPLGVPVLELHKAKRYVKVYRKDRPGDRLGAMHAFIDTTNGDVLKPASANAPARKYL
jgi:hypothetical protein